MLGNQACLETMSMTRMKVWRKHLHHLEFLMPEFISQLYRFCSGTVFVCLAVLKICFSFSLFLSFPTIPIFPSLGSLHTVTRLLIPKS